MKITRIAHAIGVADDVRNLTRHASGMPLSEAISDFAACLAGSDIQWALCGGIAVGVHARPRGTDDIDIILNDEASLEQVLRRITGFKKTRDHAVTHKRTGVEVELLTPAFINVNPAIISTAISTATRNRMGSVTIPVVTRDGLVALKLGRGNDYDRGDIKAVIRMGGDVDVSAYPLGEKELGLLKTLKAEARGGT